MSVSETAFAEISAEKNDWRAEALQLRSQLQQAQERIAGLEESLTKISAIRDSIVGMQGFNFSEHAYPLVAALDAAGFKGAGYEIARQNLGTLIEQRELAEKERDKARAVLDDAYAALTGYSEGTPGEEIRRMQAAVAHAASENLAFNFKAAREINEARTQRDDALRSLAKWQPVVETAKRVASRAMHHRRPDRDTFLRNDVEILGKLANAVDALTTTPAKEDDGTPQLERERNQLRELLADTRFYMQRHDVRGVNNVINVWENTSPVLRERIDAALTGVK